MQKVAAVAAIGRNRELGYENKLLWHIPDDLKRFQKLTVGHPIIMGRKTFESIVGYAGGPLLNRTNIVLSRNEAYHNDIVSRYNGAVLVASSLQAAIELARQQPGSIEIHIGGGAELYKQALPIIDKLYLTLIDAEAEADSFFPPYEHLFKKKVFEEQHEYKGLKYRWVDLERT